MHIDKKQISVGFIGYPNVGKSSIINTLRSKKVCKVAPIAGETKVWQYITLMRRIYLIDCPGVVYPSSETDTEKVLKGVVRVELVTDPEDYIGAVLERVRPEYIAKTYKVNDWTNPTDFLEKLAVRSGKLLKKGEPDIKIIARMVLNDWQRGKLPFYVLPPGFETPLENKNTLTVVQNLNKIRVGLEYEGDDNKELQPIANLDQAVEEYPNSEAGDASSTVTNTDGVDNTISEVDSTMDTTSNGTNEKKIVDDMEDSDGSSEISGFYSDLDPSDVEDDVTKSSSGDFVVQQVDENVEKKAIKRLTSKQRRAIERSQKRKKIGSNFYEVSNVKNRNRNKKK